MIYYYVAKPWHRTRQIFLYTFIYQRLLVNDRKLLLTIFNILFPGRLDAQSTILQHWRVMCQLQLLHINWCYFLHWLVVRNNRQHILITLQKLYQRTRDIITARPRQLSDYKYVMRMLVSWFSCPLQCLVALECNLCLSLRCIGPRRQYILCSFCSTITHSLQHVYPLVHSCQDWNVVTLHPSVNYTRYNI